MIDLQGVQRSYPTRHGNVTVLRDVNFTIRTGERVGIVGRNGAGKSTMIRLLSGAEKPNAGNVKRTMSVSWPLAFSGGFQGTLTGLDNLRFICRIYGKDWRENIDYVQDFTELGRFLNEPLKTYSSGMRSRLAFAMSMVIDFDCFLIDEIMAVGDHRFHDRCHVELFEKRADHAMVIVSHDAAYVRSVCSRISVLADGYLHNFDDLDEAYAFYYRPQIALAAPNLMLEAQPQREEQTLAALLFGHGDAPEAGLPPGIGDPFIEWVLTHPLTARPTVAHHRLDTILTADEFQQIQVAVAGQLEDDFTGRSLHTALAALADSRAACPMSQAFLMAFEAPLAMEGPYGLWQRMSFEGGSIRKAASFIHEASGRELPVRLDFHRAAAEDYRQNELAEFTIHEGGVTCRLMLCAPSDYLVRMTAANSFLLPFFAENEMCGQFGLSLGDVGLAEHVLSFSSQMPGFQVPDPLFITTAAYAVEREAFEKSSPWETRVDVAYWRGADTGTFRYRNLAEAPRVTVAQLSQSRPDLINAKINQIEPSLDEQEKTKFYQEHSLLDEISSPLEMIDYRYQIDIDGNSNSWSDFFLRLLTGAPVLKLESEMGFRQWYYDRLKPWENYVPVASNGADLIEKIEWLRQHPTRAAQIGQAGRELVLSLTFEKEMSCAKNTVSRLITMNRRIQKIV